MFQKAKMLLPHLAETHDNKSIRSQYYMIPCLSFHLSQHNLTRCVIIHKLRMTGEKWHNLKQENHVSWDHLEYHEVLGSQSNTTDQQEWLLQNSKGQYH